MIKSPETEFSKKLVMVGSTFATVIPGQNQRSVKRTIGCKGEFVFKIQTRGMQEDIQCKFFFYSFVSIKQLFWKLLLFL